MTIGNKAMMLVQDESSCINNKIVHKDVSIFPAYLPVGLLRPVASPFGRSVSAVVVHKHFHSPLDLIGTRARRRLSVWILSLDFPMRRCVSCFYALAKVCENVCSQKSLQFRTLGKFAFTSPVYAIECCTSTPSDAV